MLCYVGLPEAISGWWYTYPSDNMKVSWDDDIPNMMGKHKIHIPNQQPAFIDWDVPIKKPSICWVSHPIDITSLLPLPYLGANSYHRLPGSAVSTPGDLGSDRRR